VAAGMTAIAAAIARRWLPPGTGGPSLGPHA